MSNHKAFRTTRANSLRWRHKKAEVFERKLKHEQKEFIRQSQRTMVLMAKFPSNSAVYLQRWLKDMEDFEKNIVLIEAKIRAAGLCPVRTPYLVSRVASIAVM